MFKEVNTYIEKIQNSKPLILNITNYVTMEFMANCLLSIGAAPIMSVCNEEIEELVKISSAINLNIGTLDNEFINRCYQVINFAKKHNKPIIFDPVGSGASNIRTTTSREIYKNADIIKGNPSEIISLIENSKSLGVESIHNLNDAKDIANYIAKDNNSVVAISGKIDFITDGKQSFQNKYGSPIMQNITGMGCCLAAVIAAFRAVSNNSFESTKYAIEYFSICGSIAEQESSQPGTFKIKFLDNLYSPNFNLIKSLSESIC